ncbi:hypothetical protein [Paenibacillus sp. PL2-23]|uniref:hypothetical protein n=1 Tax=Paenibacillus sp. PL2-23 TaxID=2100729 RepID=UPI0030FB2BE1
MLDIITAALSSSITLTFALAIIPAALALLVSLFMGRSKLDPSQADEEYVGGH